MKILAIRLKNLASIEGNFEIDFTTEPLLSAGIFAISGPTGSGKSTILDALCLALFDKTPRFTATNEKIALKDVGDEFIQQTDVRNVLRKGVGEGFAEVDFVGVDGFRYSSRWMVYRAGRKINGRLQAQILRVINLDTKTELQGTKTELLSSISRLVGLTYEQFTRTVLLAQNDFATFLKSKDDVKAELLEKLTGTEIYSRISMEVFARNKEAETNLRWVKDQMDGIELLPEEEINKLTLENKDIAGQKLAGQKLITAIGEKIKWLEQLTVLTNSKAEAEGLLKEYEKDLCEADERFFLIHRVDSVQNARQLADSKRNLSQREIEQQTQLKQVEEKLTSCDKELLEAKAKYDEANKEMQKFQNEAVLLESELKKARALDVQLKTAELHFAEAEKNMKTSRNQTENYEKDIKDRGLLLDELSKQMALIDEWLTKYSKHERMVAKVDVILGFLDVADTAQQKIALVQREFVRLQTIKQDAKNRLSLAQNNSQTNILAVQDKQKEADSLQKEMGAFDLETIKKERTALILRKENLMLAYNIWKEFYISRGELANKQTKLVALQKELEKQSLILSVTSNRLSLSAREKETVQRLYDNAKLTMADSVVQLRGQLHTDEPCPVCGSLHHPHTDSDSKLDALFQDISDDYAKVIREYEKLINEYVSLNRDVEHLHVQISDLSKEIELNSIDTKEKKKRWNENIQLLSLENEANFSTNNDDEDLTQLFETMNRIVQSCLKVVNDSETIYEKKQALWEETDKQLRQLKISGEVLIEQCKQIEKEIQAVLAETDKQNALKELNQSQYNEAYTKVDGEISIDNWIDLWNNGHEEFKLNVKKLANLWTIKNKEKTDLQESFQKLSVERGGVEKMLANAREVEQKALSVQQSNADNLTLIKKERALLLHGEAADTVEKLFREKQQQAKSLLESILLEVNKLSAQYAGLEGQIKQLRETILKLAIQEQSACKELAKWISVYNEKESQTITEDELRKLMDIEASWINQERGLLNKLRETRTSAQATLKERTGQLEKHLLVSNKPDGENENMKSLLVTLDLQLSRKEELESRTSTIETTLQMHQLNKKRVKNFEVELKEMQLISERWAKLNSLIGQSTGEKFKVIAQSYTLNVLLLHANKQLELLSKRYRLQQVPDTLALQVVDRDMCDEIRTVYSLSGGESFLISLALALGLSSLSSNNMKVESLFIDEGFGSLDAESLRMAMEALEQLQSQGRKIGVISHVQEMSERISTQVILSKQANGKSKITVVG